MEKKGSPFAYLWIIVLLVSANFFCGSFPARAAIDVQITATVAVGVCGNNIVEWGEDCDGSALDGQTCESLGYDGGTLSCNLGCDFNLSECVDLGPDEGSIVFSGRAYPLSVVRILKDGQIAATTAADDEGNFATTLSDLTIGSYLFAVYAYDNNGKKSQTLTYQRNIVENEIQEVSDILMPPTLVANKSEVEQGKNIIFSGQSFVLSLVTIFLDSNNDTKTLSATSNGRGFYSYKLETESLDPEDYTAVARTTVSGYPASAWSKEVAFAVEAADEADSESSVTVTATATATDVSSSLAKSPTAAASSSADSKKADLNGDSRINLIDYSIFIYWFGRLDFPVEADMSQDGKIDLHDFSVMMYYWTG